MARSPSWTSASASEPPTDLLVEILSIAGEEDTEWLILHERLERYLLATREIGLKNLLGTVTMLRDRLLDIGNEVLSKQVHEPREGCLQAIGLTDHKDCKRVEG